MKKALKIVLYVVASFVILVVVVLTYIKVALPNIRPAADLKIEYTPERIQRGKYLAQSVSVCMDCHSTRDWTKFSGPLTDGTLGQGGERFDQNVGMPGVYYSRNITPEGITRYSDGELFRLITTGVSKEGRALFPLMPFTYYGRMDPDDIHCIIAYVRSLSPIKNEVPNSVSDFPMNFIINTLPREAEPGKRPDTTDVIAYGAYMTNASACRECHTQAEKGQILEDLAFGGGREFLMPGGGVIRSANISPDQTGLSAWTEDQFVARFKIFADSSYKPVPVAAGEFNTIMPWTMYAQMDRKDLAAIYNYLKSVKPISNTVEKWTPPSK